MSQIKAKNTKPELLVRKYLHAQGLRYKLHDRKLPGKPDLVFPKYKLLIFVNGCFWHGHSNCKYFAIPKTRSSWWEEKITRNIESDKKALLQLEQEGWRIITVWECQLKPSKVEATLQSLLNFITQLSDPSIIYSF